MQYQTPQGYVPGQFPPPQQYQHNPHDQIHYQQPHSRHDPHPSYPPQQQPSSLPTLDPQQQHQQYQQASHEVQRQFQQAVSQHRSMLQQHPHQQHMLQQHHQMVVHQQQQQPSLTPQPQSQPQLQLLQQQPAPHLNPPPQQQPPPQTPSVELSYPPQPPPSLQPHDNSLSPDSSSQQIQPLLDDAVHRLNARVAQLEAQFGLPSNHSSSSHAPPPLTSLPPPQASSAATSSSAPIAHGFVAYDVFSTAFLQPFLESCDKLGPDVAKYGAIVRRAFDAQRNYLLAASLSQKPTTGPVKGLLAPIQDAIREMHDLCDLRSNFANHQHMLYEGLQTLEWLHVDGAAPHAFMARYMGDVWGTKIRAQYKASNADQVRFAASFKALVTELMAYVEDFHPSGVTWNPDGGDVKDFLKPPSKRTKAKITLIRTLLGREPVKRNLNYSRQGTDEHDNLTKALAEWRADGEPVDKLSYRKKYGVPKLIWNTRTNANVNRRVSLYASPGITAVRMEQEEALVAKLKAQCHDNNIRWTAKDVQQYAVRDMGVSQISVRQWYSQHFLKRWPEAKGFIMRYKEAHGRETLTSTML
ncbi:hypothetical protein DYB26_003249 [Aphanomyces astaci]|uniref:CAP N-terminal domain-containing protein n=1 Tax=Aphanomyces astaci TaxID=112090 RepID=A0A397F594_APHAT|nr:hypothetical protein DYB31_002547 [Aphanomyces astaci]RHZ16870.1 hypothetical protein DYB26_003249 [Aphanomyces astaci]